MSREVHPASFLLAFRLNVINSLLQKSLRFDFFSADLWLLLIELFRYFSFSFLFLLLIDQLYWLIFILVCYFAFQLMLITVLRSF